MDFTQNDSIDIERKNVPWPASRQELDDIWSKRLKSEVLSMRLNGKQLPEIQDVLTKRYKNRLSAPAEF